MALGTLTEIAGREMESPEDTSRRYRRIYQCFSDTRTEDPLAVRLHSQLPQLFTPYPTDPGALVTSIRPRQDTEHPWRWEIEVAWSTLSLTSRSANAARSDPSQRNENPLLRPIRLTFDAESYQRAVQRDITGVLLANSAGDPFDPPVMVDDIRPTLVVRRNELTFNPLLVQQWKNAVNEDEFLSWPTNTVKVAKITAESQYENGISFVETTYVFHIADQEDGWGWTFRPLDAGFRQLVNGKLQTINGADGQPVSSPALLNGAGVASAPGAEPNFLTFTLYRQKVFADLGLF